MGASVPKRKTERKKGDGTSIDADICNCEPDVHVKCIGKGHHGHDPMGPFGLYYYAGNPRRNKCGEDVWLCV
jgi:hypothetical protein